MSKKLPTLDGLRAASILLVLASHLLPLGPKWLDLNEAVGAMGMAIFFSLSGFLITQNLLDGQPVATFFVRRAARILPLAYSYLLVVWVIFPTTSWTLIQNLLFAENYTYAWMENGHFWSLCVEVHFYLAIGAAALFFGSRGALLIPAACIAVTAIRVWNGATIDIQTHLRVDEICSGGCIAIAYHYRVLEKVRARPAFFLLAVSLLAISSWHNSQWLQYLRPYFAGLLLASALTLPPSKLRGVLASRAAAYVAKVSYALYVIHPLTAHGWMDDGSTFERYALKRPISFALTFLLAHLSTFYYEARWIELSKKFPRRPSGILRDGAQSESV
jgi:peptidoglycan/LPS O-acetylase OafA/YrhL